LINRQSLLKANLKGKQLSIGTWITIPHQAIIEILSSAGFDWMVLDLEHAAIDYQAMMNLIGHIQGNGMEALVRVSKNEEVVIKKAMDAGANGVIVPMVKNAAEAKDAVDYVKYPPHGKRGVGLSRAQQYGFGFDSYKKWLQDSCVVIVQVEHIESVYNLEAILKVEGIDGIIVGPYDLSASMGMPGDFENPKVLDAIKEVITIASNLNKPLGFHVISSDHRHLLEKVLEGYTFLAFSLDFFFLGDKARSEMLKLKSAIK
jgi:2-keto-3-deoxy-L-rhamnonate aldolase RhmA